MELYLAHMVKFPTETLGLLLKTTLVYGCWPYETGRLTGEVHKLSDYRDCSSVEYQAALARHFPSLSNFTTNDNKVCFAVRLRMGDPIIGVSFHDGDIWIGGTPEWKRNY